MQRVIAALFKGFVLAGVTYLPLAFAIPVNPNPFTIDRVNLETTDVAPGEKVPVIAHWKLASGYHAYVEQFNVVSKSAAVGSARLQDIRKVVDFFDKFSGQRRQGVKGEGELYIEFEAAKNAPYGKQTVEIEVTFQACAEDHCLLPKTVNASFEVNIGGAPSLSLLGRSIGIDDWRIWLLVFIAGILTSLTPCIFPLIPTAGWLKDYKHLYELKVNDSKILKITTTQDVINFGKQFGISSEEIELLHKYNRTITPELYQQIRSTRKNDQNYLQFICWDIVRPNWSGIEIPNYFEIRDRVALGSRRYGSRLVLRMLRSWNDR